MNGSSLDTVKAILSDPKVEKERILDKPDKQKRTPLHLASFKQNENLTKILLDFGAKRDVCDASGLQPVELAAKTARPATQTPPPHTRHSVHLTDRPSQGRRKSKDLLMQEA